MQTVSSRPAPLSFGHGGASTPVIVGFRAASTEPESPSKGANAGSCQRRHSLLSDLLAAGALLRAAERHGGGGGGTEEEEDGDVYCDGDTDDDVDMDALDDEEMSLLEGLEAAWSPSSSIYSAGAVSRASTASSSRPIAIPAATYFKDQAQRAHLDRLNKKRQWYSQQQEQERLLGKTGAKAAAQQVPRPPPKHHKQFNGHGGQQK